MRRLFARKSKSSESLDERRIEDRHVDAARQQILQRELYQWQQNEQRRPPVQALRQRYIREWLNANAAGGYVTYHADTGRYSLSPEQALVLAVSRMRSRGTPWPRRA